MSGLAAVARAGSSGSGWTATSIAALIAAVLYVGTPSSGVADLCYMHNFDFRANGDGITIWPGTPVVHYPDTVQWTGGWQNNQTVTLPQLPDSGNADWPHVSASYAVPKRWFVFRYGREYTGLALLVSECGVQYPDSIYLLWP